ncbi:hypothetical protein B0H13DRAFT_2546766 [Mycena leptocephala]|nr:hypothetical protein B0H13DRAFT_2546766 [Mycena leptocephala]
MFRSAITHMPRAALVNGLRIVALYKHARWFLPRFWSPANDVFSARSLCEEKQTQLGADPGLAAILPLFNGVHRLVVDSGWALWVTTPFHGDFQTAFLSFLRTPTLRCLGLLNCLGVPSSFICLALSSYREVALINIDIREGHPSTYSDRLQVEPISGLATKLDRLVLDGSSKDRVSLHGILLSKDKSPLLRLEVEHLELFVQMQKSLYGLGIAHLYSFSLQTLVIHFRDRHDQRIHLPNLPRLRSLTPRASVRTSRLPVAVCAAISDLPTCMLNIVRLIVVIDANFEEALVHPRHYANVEEALKKLRWLGPSSMNPYERGYRELTRQDLLHFQEGVGVDNFTR